jgi:hypothetical protein
MNVDDSKSTFAAGSSSRSIFVTRTANGYAATAGRERSPRICSLELRVQYGFPLEARTLALSRDFDCSFHAGRKHALCRFTR